MVGSVKVVVGVPPRSRHVDLGRLSFRKKHRFRWRLPGSTDVVCGLFEVDDFFGVVPATGISLFCVSMYEKLGGERRAKSSGKPEV
jgi:hypothetical protein